MVTPRVEASPDRSDFAKLGETIAASLVQAAQEHANHASLLEQTKQFADDIRSQVAPSSSDPAFHTYASGLMAYEAILQELSHLSAQKVAAEFERRGLGKLSYRTVMRARAGGLSMSTPAKITHGRRQGGGFSRALWPV